MAVSFPLFLLLVLHIGWSTANYNRCTRDDILRTLSSKSSDASSFCATYLGHTTLSASIILYDVTVIGATSTQTFQPTETATIYKVVSATFSTKTSTTSYSSQTRVAKSTLFSVPTPAPYVATFAPSRISSACSCLSVSVQNIPANVNCDGLPSKYVSTDTQTEYTAFTATGGKKTTTVKFTYTSTKITSTQTIRRPFPTTCPEMNDAEYVGADGSPWFRSCSDSWLASLTFSSVKATSLDHCIDKCVANNQKVKYTQCIAVLFLTDGTDECDLLSFVTTSGGGGTGNIAGLKFYEHPRPYISPAFCKSAVSSFLATATPP